MSTHNTAFSYIESLWKEVSKTLDLPQTRGVNFVFPKSEYGDISTNAPLVISKQTGSDLNALAQAISEKFKAEDQEGNIERIEEKNGFLNFWLSQKCLAEELSRILNLKSEASKSDEGQGKTVIVEYFQNNAAKPPHVGHLRTGVVGDALYRIFETLGYRTISDTHIGDWGVQFGILIHAYKTSGSKEKLEADPITELERLYVEMRKVIDDSPEDYEKSKAEFAKLEAGDEENRAIWKWFVDLSLKDFEWYRKELGLKPFDYNLGESFYESHMSKVVEEFKSKGLVSEGETGELYVDLEPEGLGRCILIKSDGATTYHLRDFATYIFRKKEFEFYKNIYVVDNRQSHHFRQLFKVLDKAGYPASQDSVHADVGFMSLEDGAISTRKGNVISLKDLLEEGEKRSLQIIEQKNSDLADKVDVAKKVARAAVKYFDLSHNRKTEFMFSWDKALAFEGNSGPYMQYSHARIKSILRKNSATPETNIEFPVSISKSESLLIRKLTQFNPTLSFVAKDLLPNLLCNYLFDLSQVFNQFYEIAPVLQEPDKKLRLFRLQLVTATAHVIACGLMLLGIEAPEEM